MNTYTTQGTQLQIRNTAAVATQPITDGLYSRYIAYLDAAPKTVETYTKALRHFAKWTTENGINQPTREDILNYREELKKDHKATTVQNYIIATRLFFQWTEQEGLYPNVADHVKGAKLDRSHKKGYLSPRQVKKVLEGVDRTTAQGLRDYAILALMFTGGLRTIEVVRANVEDLTTAGERTVLYVQGKGHEEKAVAINIPPETEDAIRQYIAIRGKLDGKEPLFASQSDRNAGQRMTTRSISRLVKNSFIAAGFTSDKLTAHSTRHTAVNLALMGGEKLEEVRKFARHADISTTMIYVRELDDAANKCSATVAAAIF